MTISFSFTGAIPVTRSGMPLFLEKTSFVSFYGTAPGFQNTKKARKGSDLFPLGKQSKISTLCTKVTKYNPVLFSIVSPAFWDES